MHITLEEAYRALELEVSASEDEVRRQYKKLALKTHPDKNPDDPEAHKKFLLISESYKRITDPDSFKDDEDDAGPSEEEMTAMFNMMFADMLGGFGFGGGFGGVPMDMFDILEDLMDEYEDGDEDDEGYGHGYGMSQQDMLDAMMLNELLAGMQGPPPARHKAKKVNTSKLSNKAGKKKGKSKSSSSKANESKAEEWETASEEEEEARPRKAKKSTSKPVASKNKNWEEFDDDDDSEGDDDMNDMMAFKKMQSMAGQLGLNEADMMQFMMGGGDPSLYFEEEDDDEDYDEDNDVMKSSSSSKKKRNKKKKDKAKAKAKSSASETSGNLEPSHEPASSSSSSKADGKSKKAYSGGEESSSRASQSIRVGDKVLVRSMHRGRVAFVGDVHYAKGTFVGVIMDNPALGKNNGVIRGVEYFKCTGDEKGLMVSLSEVAKL